MNVWNGLSSYPSGTAPACATLGNFDGVHLGHRKIATSVTARAAALGAPSLLVTFEPHPTRVVAPERTPRLLQTRGQKLAALEETGLEGVLFVEFDRSLADLSPDYFVALLIEHVPITAVYVGGNFRFGRGRAGDARTLADLGSRHGFDVEAVGARTCDGVVVSSSEIRRAVASGDVDRARKMLGRPFALCGRVVRGEGRGRELSFPTANLAADNELLPAKGVYVTETVHHGARYPGVTNVGVRPTFGDGALSIETHILEYEGELYDATLEVRFLGRIRDELRFDSAAALSDQIGRDLAAAEAYFENCGPGS